MFKYSLKNALFRWPLAAKDRWANRLAKSCGRRILVTRYAGKRSYMYRDFLAWVEARLPELRGRMEFRRLPCHVRDWTPYSLHVSWAGDTLDVWSPAAFHRACRLADTCRRLDVPMVNPVDVLANTGKSRGGQLMRAAGVETPQVVAITSVEQFVRDHGGLRFPLLIREERGHGRPTLIVRSPGEVDRPQLESYEAPIAAEFIDTRGRDGLYRKYRCVLAGDIGVARHLIANEDWEVRPDHRVISDELVGEELAYLNTPCPHHEILNRARRALGLDVVGFDYSLDAAGRVIVWEANSFANLNYPKKSRASHVWPATERTFAAIARLYLVRAGIAAPGWIDAMLEGYASRTSAANEQAAPRMTADPSLVAA